VEHHMHLYVMFCKMFQSVEMFMSRSRRWKPSKHFCEVGTFDFFECGHSDRTHISASVKAGPILCHRTGSTFLDKCPQILTYTI
jgi:hypothetical protein